jgi:hypothetical protein
MGNRMSITLQVIVRALFPGRGPFSRAGEVPLAPADLERVTGPDGKLLLRIPGCGAPAAPFVLFRLKRAGYSDCRAIATPDGLQVEAIR